MDFLRGLGIETGSVASTFLWSLLIVTAATGIIVVIALAIGRLLAASQPVAERVDRAVQSTRARFIGGKDIGRRETEVVVAMHRPGNFF